jgi:serine-type D-Ala-D-Ala carboxypeptidase (penicillin-binding protein 5/6)
MRRRMTKRPVVFLVLFCLLALMFGPVMEGQAAEPAGSKKPAVKQSSRKARSERPPVEPSQEKAGGSETSPGQINARSAILVEVTTGTVLFEQNADEVIEPASFTKVLTLYLVYEALRNGRIRMQDEVWIGDEAWKTGGSKMFVGVGTKVPLEELIKGIAVVSGNDACVAAAEHLSGSVDTFVLAMNAKAKELGMTKSHFMNPHGLPADGQVTTARNMATLGFAYMRRFPEALQIHSMKEYTYNNITQFNRNHLLLKDATVDGLKTGFVAASGYHLAATAQRDGMRLLAVVMGAANPSIREREAMKLLNYGFRFWTLLKPFGDNQPVTTLKVWKGVKDQVDLYAVEPAAFVLPQSQKSALRYEVQTVDDATAPVAVNEPLGKVIFSLSDQPRKTITLVSQENIEEAGFFKRAWHSILNIHKIDWVWVGGIAAAILALLGLAAVIANRRTIFRKAR